MVSSSFSLREREIYGKTLMKFLIFCLLLITASTLSAQEINGGTVVGKNIFGLATDYNGDPLLIEERPLIYSESRFNEQVILGKQSFLVSGFDHPVGSVYVTYIDSKTKRYVDTTPLNLSSINGLSYPGTGTRTPWGSVLLSEGGLIDGANPKSFSKDFRAYYKGKDNLIKPYHYGWPAEIIVLDAEGKAKAIKDYAMGRVFADQILVMPDARTLYMLDSKNSGQLYAFVAEQPYSMVKGALYAVTKSKGKYAYKRLGESSALKMKFKLKKMNFKSLFSSRKPDNGACSKGFTYTKTLYGEECLKLNSRNKKYAGLFEPLRSMAIKGVPGFRAKGGQLQFDADKKQLTVRQQGNASVTFGMDNNTTLNSQYTIKEAI